MLHLVTAMLALLAVGACMEPQPDPAGRAGPSGVPARVRIGDVHWYVDYDAAVEIARAADKPLWVHFGEHPG